jgi:Uma2 family endonuclease
LPSATPIHAIIRDLTGDLVRSYLRQNPIGKAIAEIDCLLTADTVRRPDLSIFLGERSRQMDLDKTPAPFAPDIAVEILSPSESAIDARRKVRDYLRAGSKEVWRFDHSNGEVLVHTSSSIQVLQGTDVLTSPLLPGFSATVAHLVVDS